MLIMFRIFLLIFIIVVANGAAINKKIHGCQDSKFICLTPGCIHAASHILNSIDSSVDPCKDFYKFACGGYIKRADLPDDKAILMSFNIISDQVTNQLRTILESPTKANESAPFVLMKKLYNICLNTEDNDKYSMSVFKKLLHKLGGWPLLEGKHWNESRFDWKTTKYKFRKVGLPTTMGFFAVMVGVDSRNSSQRIIKIDQSGLSLSREFFIKGFNSTIVKKYYDYLVDVALIFGADKQTAIEELKTFLEFEIKIAKILLPKEARRNKTMLQNLMTIKELQKRWPSIPWLEYIKSVLLIPEIEITSDEVVNVAVPQYLTDLEILLNNTEKRVLANYLFTRVVTSTVSYLTTELINRRKKFGQVMDGRSAVPPRWKVCVNDATSSMYIAMSYLYIKEYFKEDAKAKAITLTSDIQASFINLLKHVDWMDETTRKHALEKAETLNAEVAYPEELLDEENVKDYYKGLESSTNYLEFTLNIIKFYQSKALRKLREVVDKTDWTKSSYSFNVNAYYKSIENSILLPAGVLQGAFFDSERPQYMNYGAMGFIIGHEITHGFDDIGRQFNKDGELSEWWADDTKKAFDKKARCIIEQYGNYTEPEVNLQLNGINTQGENIADNGGAKEAYLAYQAWVERNGKEPMLPGLEYTPQQMFWISSANLWCSKQRKQFIKEQIYTDSHAPSYFRVIGAFSNLKYFSQDFNCPLGSKMNPENKCEVW